MNDIHVLGTLPADLMLALRASPPHHITSSLSGVSALASDGAPSLPVLRAGATLSFVDSTTRTKWTASVRLWSESTKDAQVARAEEKEGEEGKSGAGGDDIRVVSEDATLERDKASLVHQWPRRATLLVEEASWQSSVMAEETALSPALPKGQATEETGRDRAPALKIEPPSVSDVPAVQEKTVSPSPASPTSQLPRLTETKEFHFYVDTALERTQQHAGAAKMSLGAILACASGGGSQDGAEAKLSPLMRELLEPLLIDVVHFLSPAPRSLRDVLHYVFGATGGSDSSSASESTSSPFYVSLRHCARSTRYRQCFSLSDVKHLTDLLCQGGGSQTTGDAQQPPSGPAASSSGPSSQLLELNGVGFCFLDVDKYASKLERQKAANRAYALLASLIEQSMRTASSPATSPRLVRFDPTTSAAQSKDVAVNPLVAKYFSEAKVAEKILSMELLVDRDIVLAVKSRGGGIMQGLGRKAEADKRGHPKKDEDAEDLRDGSANGSDAEDEEKTSHAGSDENTRDAPALAQYKTMQDIRINWAAGDLAGLLPNEEVPRTIVDILTARQAERARRLGSAKETEGEAPPATRHRTEAAGGGSPPTPQAWQLDPLPTTTPSEYSAAVAQYTTLRNFTQTLTTRLEAYQDVTREAQQWTQRVDRARWADSLVRELGDFFGRNGKKAGWLSKVLGDVEREAYRLERELRDYACLAALGVRISPTLPSTSSPA